MLSSIQEISSKGAISVLPDYFLDRFIKIDSIDDLYLAIKNKALQGGGGSLRGVRQMEVKGGNAVNLGYALGKLGVRVNLLAIADVNSMASLRASFQGLKNVEVAAINGRSGLTLALEFPLQGRRVNVMISDTGDLEGFDGSSISASAWDNISDSKITAIVNWSANEKGTELCEKAFSISREKGHRNFLDPADVSDRSKDIPNLKQRIFDKGLVDYLAVNDNELRLLVKVMGNYSLPHDYSSVEIMKAAKVLSENAGAIVDIHTRKMSITCEGSETIKSPCHRVDQRTVTGAGDVWDAGDLVGYILGWDNESRLRFANAAAGLYVSREDAEAPNSAEVLSFINSDTETRTTEAR